MGDADQKALNALAKGAGVTAIGMMISKALTYFYRISIARFLGPNAYGQLSLALMVVGIASTIAYLSLGSGLKKFIPEYRSRDDFSSVRGTVLSALQLSIPVSIILWALTFFGAEFIATTFFDNTAIIPLIKIISFTIITRTLSSLFFDTTLGFNKIIYKTITDKILQNIVQLGITISLLILGYKVVSAAWGWLAGSTVAMILAFYFLEKKVGPIITSKVQPKYNRMEMLRFSSPLLISGIISTLLGWMDTGLLGYYMTDFEVGLYNAALPTALLILLPDNALGSLALPSFSELKERDDKSVEGSLQTTTYWIFSLTFPTFLIMALFSEQALTILFGSQYAQASAALSILAFGYMVGSAFGQTGSMLESTGHTDYIFYNSVVILVINLILNMVLIPVYGLVGAAIATASSTAIGNALLFAEVWKKEKIISIPIKKNVKVAITAITPLFCIILLDNILFTDSPYWAVIPFMGAYFISYIMLHLLIIGLGKEEIEIIKKIGKITGKEEELIKILDELVGKEIA